MKRFFAIAVLLFFLFFTLPVYAASSYTAVVKVGDGKYAVAVGWNEGTVLVHRDTYIYGCVAVSPADTKCRSIKLSGESTETFGALRWITDDSDAAYFLNTRLNAFPINTQRVSLEIGSQLAFISTLAIGALFAYGVVVLISKVIKNIGF